MIQPRYRTLILVFGLCLAIAATFFFGYRAGRTARHARWQNEPVRAWMSVPFIAHTHHTSEDVLFQAIGVPPDPHDHRPVRDIARAKKLPPADLVRELQDAIGKVSPAGKTP